MPFTFVHPAIVLPTKEKFEKYLDFTGLVIGCMAPDFEYFLRFKPVGLFGHKAVGFILINLPLCFVMAFLFHKIIKKPLILSLPSPFDKWYQQIAQKEWKIGCSKGILIFIYSSLIGMITHVLWDAFTHQKGEFVVLFPMLAEKVHIFDYYFPLYKILQHGSTLLGSFAIIICLFWIRNSKAEITSTPKRIKLIYYMSVLFIGLLFLLTGIGLSLIDLNTKSIGVAVVTFINGIFFGCIFLSVIYHILFLKNNQKSNR